MPHFLSLCVSGLTVRSVRSLPLFLLRRAFMLSHRTHASDEQLTCITSTTVEVKLTFLYGLLVFSSSRGRWHPQA